MTIPGKQMLAIFLTAVLLTGCYQQPTQPSADPTTTGATQMTTAPEQTEPTQTTAQTTAPAQTQPTETEPTETQSTEPPATQPKATEPKETQPKATEPAPTQPQPTEPPATQPTEQTGTVQTPVTEQETQVIADATASVPNMSTVSAPGTLVKTGGDATIDYSNTGDGYVMVYYSQPVTQRLKVQVKGPATTYTYNLPTQQWTAFPLSDENGDYQITVYINVVDSKYAAVLSLTTSVQMKDEFEPFLRSNQYVNFDAAPNAVATAASLTQGIGDPLEKVTAIYHFVVGSISYDKELAATVTSGYLPDLDNVLASRKGICFDYAALMTGMLRSQGVPAKLVIGYAGDAYHAWINVWSESTGWVDGVIFFDGTSWQRMDPTFASSGGDPAIQEFIGNGSNYSAKYIY